MTRISFIITSGSSIILGSNIEPLPSINDILNTISYRDYQQCIPYIPLNILLRLKLCIPLNEISLWMNLITKAVSAAMSKNKLFSFHFDYFFFVFKGESNVNIMLKGVQEGVTTTG
jgi:hypothetical protein